MHVKQLGIDVDQWIYTLKDVKQSGSSHIIADIQTKHLNKFLKFADEVCLMKNWEQFYIKHNYVYYIKYKKVGLMTTYFHFVITTQGLF